MQYHPSIVQAKITKVLSDLDAEIDETIHKINVLQRFLSSPRYGKEQKSEFWKTLRLQVGILKSLRLMKAKRIEDIKLGKMH